MKKTIYFLINMLAFAACCNNGQKPINREPESAKVAMYKGKPTIFINDKPQTPFLYGTSDGAAGINTWEEIPQHNIMEFAKSGTTLFIPMLFLEKIWNEDGTVDLSYAQKQVRGVLDVCPDASIMFYITLTPPRWWHHKNPDECVVYADGPHRPYYESGLRASAYDDGFDFTFKYSLASKKWRKDVSDILAEFCKQFSKTEEGKVVFSLIITAGIFGENNYFGFINNEPDNSKPMIERFREVEKEKYKTNRALQQAWHDKNITFETIQGPTMDERINKSTEVFRNPEKEQKMIDYFQCYHSVVADEVIHFNKLVKENWPRPIITGSFYGYFFSTFFRETYIGHADVERVLNSPYIDMLGAPMTYFPDSRETGGANSSRGLSTSCLAHGKIWLDQNDTPTKLLMPWEAKYDTAIQEDIARVRRDNLVSQTQGYAVWMFDLGLRGENPYNINQATFGWWDDPKIQKDIKLQKAIFDKTVEREYKSEADVLLVYDTEIFYYLSTNKACTPVNYVNNYWMHQGIFHASVVPDNIQLADLDKVDLSQYKVVVFNNTYKLTEEQRKFIKGKVEKDGRDIIWNYAPGYFDGNKFDVKYMNDVTGMNFEEVTISKKPEIQLTGIVKNPYKYGMTMSPISPLFTVNDKEAESFGVYDGTNKTAIAKKKLKDFTSWYIALPAYNTEFLTEIISQTGAHKYSDHKGDVIYCGNGILGIHSKDGGVRNITLKNGKVIKLEFNKIGGTAILDSETGEILLN
jgi:hypothetical protein